ncbi:MAG: hypothetical protein GY793_06080 [Proteobacteria bacterium]|nr:hypothetical protein [Pseudomonadota bacterium]
MGVDSDADGRRDKTEREIAFLFYPDLDAIGQMNEVAKVVTQLYNAHMSQYQVLFKYLLKHQFKLLGCFSFKEYDPDKVLQATTLMFDTPLRIRKLREMETENLSGEGYPFISIDFLEQECYKL